MSTIVLNEHDWAKEQIDNKTLGSKPYETFCRVAKYYLDNGATKKEARRQLDSFLLMCEPTASLPKWSETLDCAIKRASKYDAIDIDCIKISKPEMDKIDSLNGKQLRRLAFALLCLAKYWDIVNTHGDHWVNSKDCDIMRMANINTSIKRQSLMYHTLSELGLIRFSKKIDNTNVRVCFIEDGETAMEISDFRNLGYQYLKYHGEPFFECENCGLTVKIRNNTGRKQKYCDGCAVEIHTQQIVNSVMKRRAGCQHLSFDSKTYTVYLHTFPDGKIYVGMTSQPLRNRWRGGAGYSSNVELTNAIKECGWDNVRHYILFKGLDLDSARFIESYYIKTRHAYLPEYGYNNKSGSYSKITDGTTPEYIKVEVDGNGVEIGH